MSRRKNGSEGKLVDLPVFHQHVAVNVGRQGMGLISSGVFAIAQWLWMVEDLKRRNPKMPLAKIKKLCPCDYESELQELLQESALKRNGDKLRLLADAIEKTGPQKPIDPLRSVLLSLKVPGGPKMTARQVLETLALFKTRKDHIPTLKSVNRAAKELGAPLVPVRRGPKKGTKQKSVHRKLR